MDRLDALRLLVRLAERGTFSAAARDLKIKQPTASKAIAQLEAEFGASLVQRTTRSLRITEVGERVLDHARQILAGFDQIGAELRVRQSEPSGHVRVSVPVVLGRMYVIPALHTFLRQHPRVSADVIFDDRYVSLVEERFDVAVRVGVPAETSARGYKITDSRRVLVASPAYLEAHGTPATPRDLVQHQCLVHGDSNVASVWRFGRAAGKEQPVAVRGRLTATNTEALLAMARDGFGIALLADWLVHAELRKGRLVPLLTAYSRPVASLYALTAPERVASHTARALARHLVSFITPRITGLGA